MTAGDGARRAVLDLVERGSRFLVTGHRRPDADALGSALGWAAILRALGKEAHVFSVDPVPRTLRYLDEVAEVTTDVPDGPWDACFVMDAASSTLVPPIPESVRGPLVMFDHHSAHDDSGDLVLRESDACATGVLVMRMMAELGLEKIPPRAASPIYAAIVADTGGFRYPGTDAETHRMAARLIEAGAQPWPAAYHLFEGWPLPRMRLLSLVLEALELDVDGRLALLRVTRAMIDAVGADEEMVEGLVNYGRMLEGVEIAAVVWELISSDGAPETKISLRSRGDIDVSAIAIAFEGGGHHAAAGANVRAELEPTLERVRALAKHAIGA